MQVLGCEAAYVIFLPEHVRCLIPCSRPCSTSIATGFFLLIVPALQLAGKTLRVRDLYSLDLLFWLFMLLHQGRFSC